MQNWTVSHFERSAPPHWATIDGSFKKCLMPLITFLQFWNVSQILWSGKGHRRQRSLKHNRGSVTHLMVISHCSATLGPDGWGTHFRDRHTAVVLNIFSDVSFSNWDSGCCEKNRFSKNTPKNISNAPMTRLLGLPMLALGSVDN